LPCPPRSTCVFATDFARRLAIGFGKVLDATLDFRREHTRLENEGRHVGRVVTLEGVSTPSIRFGVQAGVTSDATAWQELARRVESLGFDALYVADHPGVTASPFAALASAAAVTSTLKLGTYVCNAGVRDPVALAADAATVDVLSNGRFILGVGAGHTPAEWTMHRREYPSGRARVARLEEMVDVVTRLLAGEVVTFDGNHVRTDEAFLLTPRPVQPKIPLLVGGNGTQLLRLAASHADIISLTGLGRTLEDGHHHTANWSVESIDDRVGLVRDGMGNRDAVLDAGVQHVEITDDRAHAAERVARAVPGLTAADVLAAPYSLIGTADQLVDELTAHRERWGFTSYVVRAQAVNDVASLLDRLRG
jgi:probable F420-dependent oxidoreductase